MTDTPTPMQPTLYVTAISAPARGRLWPALTDGRLTARYWHTRTCRTGSRLDVEPTAPGTIGSGHGVCRGSSRRPRLARPPPPPPITFETRRRAPGLALKSSLSHPPHHDIVRSPSSLDLPTREISTGSPMVAPGLANLSGCLRNRRGPPAVSLLRFGGGLSCWLGRPGRSLQVTSHGLGRAGQSPM